MKEYISIAGHAILICFISLLVGCSPKNAPFWKDDSPPSQKMLIGTWRVSGTTNMTITLSPNGKAEATNFPFDVGEYNSQLQIISGAGYWELERKYAAWVLDITFQKCENQMDIRKWKGSMIFSMTLDNPDSDRVVVFEKKKNH